MSPLMCMLLVVVDGEVPPVSPSFSDDFQDFIAKCLTKDPRQ